MNDMNTPLDICVFIYRLLSGPAKAVGLSAVHVSPWTRLHSNLWISIQIFGGLVRLDTP